MIQVLENGGHQLVPVESGCFLQFLAKTPSLFAKLVLQLRHIFLRLCTAMIVPMFLK